MYHGLRKLKILSIAIGAAAALSVLGSVSAQAGSVMVNCIKNNPDSIAEALAAGATDIIVNGVCNERVVVKTSNVTIAGKKPGDGMNYTVDNRNAVVVLGAQNVVLDNLTITALIRPLSVSIGSTATISNSVLNGPVVPIGRAILFVGDNSWASLESTTVNGGILGIRHSTLKLVSSIVTGDLHPPLFLIGSSARVWDTDFTGELIVSQNSRIEFGVPIGPAGPSTIDATGRPGAIRCFDQSMIVKGGLVTVTNRSRELTASDIEFGATRPVTCTLTNLGNPVVICPESIQARIDEGIENRLIEVMGDCTENVVVDVNGVTLDGGGSATITGDGFTPAITITADQVAIEDWAEIDGDDDFGIVVSAGGSAIVHNNIVITGEDGIFVKEAAFVEVNNSNVVDANEDGIVASQNGTALIIDSDISNNGRFGVGAFGGGAVNINGGNTINNNGREGVFAAGGQLNVAAIPEGNDNTVQDNDLDELVVLNRNDIGCSSYARLRVADLIKSTTHRVTFNGSCAMPFTPNSNALSSHRQKSTT